MSDEAEEKPMPALVQRLGRNHKLVKRWRVGAVSSGWRDTGEGPGLYVEPSNGLFYARVPETNEGTLYVAELLHDLNAEVKVAWTALQEREAEAAGQARAWERRIHIQYRSGNMTTGGFLTEEDSPWGKRWQQPEDLITCQAVGALVFSRYERSPQPDDKRFDAREWEEDFDARMRRWEASDPRHTPHRRMITQEDHRKTRPVRKTSITWGPGRIPSFWARNKATRDVPWDPDTWERLKVFTQRFEALHKSLDGYLVQATEEDFLAQLMGGDRQLTMTPRTAPPPPPPKK